jgi:hypothetical protein
MWRCPEARSNSWRRPLRRPLLSLRGQGDPDEIKGWLRKLEKPHRISFLVVPRVHLPWGLAYDGDPQNLLDNANPLDASLYRDFWCLKYWLSAVYLGITPKALSAARSANKVRVIGVLNRRAQDEAFQSLPAIDQQVFTDLQSCWNATLFSSQDLFDNWPELSKSDSLLYFYCHASQTNLALSTTDEITIDDLRLKLRREAKDCQDIISLVVLNGCATATGAAGGGFLEATGKPPFCGFVGTETEVPDVFAMKFGCELLRRLLCSGEPIFKVMGSLREEHWPLSLVYSLYCYPQLQITPDRNSLALSAFSEKNFCVTPVGSKRLQNE